MTDKEPKTIDLMVAVGKSCERAKVEKIIEDLRKLDVPESALQPIIDYLEKP